MGKCPRDIEALIDLANRTGRRELESLADIWLNLGEGQDMWSAARQALVGLPRAFWDYVGPVGYETRGTFVPKWDSVYRARRTLSAIINTSTGPIGLSDAVGVMSATLSRDVEGKLQVSLAADVQLLLGIEASRLGRCRQCGEFLWMSRLRAEPFCSDACRQAKWRDRNPEKYEKAQIKSERKRAEREARKSSGKELRALRVPPRKSGPAVVARRPTS